MSERDLWLSFSITKDKGLIFRFYGPWLIECAKAYQSNRNNLALDVIVSDMSMGMMEAIDQYEFDPAKGSFRQWAYKFLRRAAIDASRERTWVPRQRFKKSCAAQESVNQLANKLGRNPTQQEIDDELGPPIEMARMSLAGEIVQQVPDSIAKRTSLVITEPVPNSQHLTARQITAMSLIWLLGYPRGEVAILLAVSKTTISADLKACRKAIKDSL